MTEICFVRHGETDWNLAGLTQGSTDIPLNDTGRRQARVAAAVLGRERWDALYSSTLSRARDTAQIIADILRVPFVAQWPELSERNFGVAEGMSTAERRRIYVLDEPELAEPWPAVGVRMEQAAQAIIAAHPRGRILVVSHGGAINALLRHIFRAAEGPGHTLLANTALNLLRYDAGSWSMVYYNRDPVTEQRVNDPPATLAG